MKKLLFCRHGEAVANEAGLLAGSRSDSPLTEKGRKQAIDTANNLRGHVVDLIVSSSLIRASETAKIIADILDYNKTIEQLDLFSERDFGDATNLPLDQAFHLVDSGMAKGVESLEDFGARAVQAVEWIKQKDAGTVLVVSHAGFGQMIGHVLAGGNPENFLSYPNLENGQFYEFKLED